MDTPFLRKGQRFDGIPVDGINAGIAARLEQTGGGPFRLPELVAASPGTVRDGLVSSATAATFSSGSDTLTPGTLEIYPFSGNTLDRTTGARVTIPFRYTSAPPAGAYVSWIGEKLITFTCEGIEGWS